MLFSQERHDIDWLWRKRASATGLDCKDVWKGEEKTALCVVNWITESMVIVMH